jgi:hypothetical protein
VKLQWFSLLGHDLLWFQKLGGLDEELLWRQTQRFGKDSSAKCMGRGEQPASQLLGA